MTTNVFIYFDGNCEEAFKLYKTVFGGEFTSIGRYSDMPAQEGMPRVPENEKNKIMHIQLPISKETWLRGADNLIQNQGNRVKDSGFSIVVTANGAEEARRVFEGLSVGGKVSVPMTKQFWGDYMGVFTDKFGLGWIINYTPEK